MRPSVIVAALLASTAVAAPPAGPTAPLRVVAHFPEGSGTLHVALFDGPAGYPRDPSRAIHRVEVRMDDGAARVTLPVAPGTWGVSLWLDEDGDGEMRTNWIGIPSEPLGVVGSKPTLFAPVSWDRNTVAVPAEGLEAEVSMFRL